MTTTPPIPDEVLAEAGFWLLRLESEDADDRDDFTRWLDADPLHALAFAAIAETVSAERRSNPAYAGMAALPAASIADKPRSAGLSSFARGTKRPPRAPWRMAASIALLALSGAAAATLFGDGLLADRYATAPGELREVVLADGSRVHLNGGTRLSVRYRDGLRALTLREGEAVFDVAEDHARPFRVRAGARVVEAVGTEFDIEHRGSSVAVGVAKGTVAIADPSRIDTGRASEAPGAVLVAHGNATSYGDRGALQPVRAVPAEQVGAWRRNMLVYERVPLATVMQGLERHFGGRFQLDPRIAGRVVTISLPLRDRASVVQALESVQSLRATQSDATTVTFAPR